MKNNLIPTAITDRNGRQTTVHKKTAVSTSGSLGKLAGIAPKLPSSVPASGLHPDDKKKVKVTLHVAERNGYKSNVDAAIGPGSLLHDMGFPAKSGDKHTVSISRGELFDYLKMGVTIPEAALLSTQGSFNDWMNDAAFIAATPASLARIKRKDDYDIAEIGRTVDALRAYGVTPKKAQAILANGMKDQHLDGVLDIGQLCALFDRFEYSPSSIRGKVTEYEATIDGLVDGRIPFENFEAGYMRTTMKSALDQLYPEGKKFARGRESLTDTERQDILDNPHKIKQAIEVTELVEGSGRDFVAAHRAVETYGFDNARKYGHQLLFTKREDGTHIGVEGARQVQEMFSYLNKNVQTDYKSQRKDNETSPNVFIGRGEGRTEIFTMTAEEAVSLIDAGATPEVVAAHVRSGLNANRILAVVKKDTTTTLASGWL